MRRRNTTQALASGRAAEHHVRRPDRRRRHQARGRPASPPRHRARCADERPDAPTWGAATRSRRWPCPLPRRWPRPESGWRVSARSGPLRRPKRRVGSPSRLARAAGCPALTSGTGSGIATRVCRVAAPSATPAACAAPTGRTAPRRGSRSTATPSPHPPTCDGSQATTPARTAAAVTEPRPPVAARPPLWAGTVTAGAVPPARSASGRRPSRPPITPRSRVRGRNGRVRGRNSRGQAGTVHAPSLTSHAGSGLGSVPAGS